MISSYATSTFQLENVNFFPLILKGNFVKINQSCNKKRHILEWTLQKLKNGPYYTSIYLCFGIVKKMCHMSKRLETDRSRKKKILTHTSSKIPPTLTRFIIWFSHKLEKPSKTIFMNICYIMKCRVWSVDSLILSSFTFPV